MAIKLHVFLARGAPVGVVLRRGPSKLACLIGWNRKTDEFQNGQWLKARIKERRSDLSPDGKNFLYFASNHNGIPEEPNFWTAISHPPYFTATHFWPNQHSWYGGGLFIDDEHFWLNDRICRNKAKPIVTGLTRVKEHSEYANPEGDDSTIYFLRLKRDGWVLKQATEHTHIWEKYRGNWTLRKYSRQGITTNETHELENAITGEKLGVKPWEWADFDDSRLAFTEAGKLFSLPLEENERGQINLLHDFNDMSFENVPAPYGVANRFQWK